MARGRTYQAFESPASDECPILSSRRLRKQRLDARRDLRGRYNIRFLSCLALSLCVVIVAANAPIAAGWESIGWYVIRPSERVSIEVMEITESAPVESGTPITAFESDDDEQATGDELLLQERKEQASATDAGTASDTDSSRMLGRKVVDAAQSMPKIIGGLGSYYIHIEYPEEAVKAGVEGRLVLSFIVETDGRTTGVEVIEKLHPACDSAAVRALRRTRFAPGSQNGDLVRVRMRLPVRFKLVGPDPPSQSSSSSPASAAPASASASASNST